MISLLEGKLKVEAYYDMAEAQHQDNVHLLFIEDCPKEHKIFDADEVRIALTPDQTEQLTEALRRVAEESRFVSGQAAKRRP